MMTAQAEIMYIKIIKERKDMEDIQNKRKLYNLNQDPKDLAGFDLAYNHVQHYHV